MIIIIAGVAVYWDTYDAPLQFDDKSNLSDRPSDSGISPTISDFMNWDDAGAGSGKAGVFADFRLFKSRYLFWKTLAINYRLGGTEVFGYHLVNNSIHFANSVLLYLLVLITFRTDAFRKLKGLGWQTALLAGLVFCVHPALTEGVTYVSQRSELLAVMFGLLSLSSYAASRLPETGRERFFLYPASIVFMAMAMMSKETAFVLPLAVGLYEFAFFSGRPLRRTTIAAPLLLCMLIIPYFYAEEYLFAEGAGVAGFFDQATRHYNSDYSRSQYFYTQLTIIPQYMRLLIIPIGQSISHNPARYDAFFSPRVASSFLFLSGLVISAAFALVRPALNPLLRLAGYGVLWFFLGFIIHSSFLPMHEFMVEYRLYMPSAGAAVAFAALSCWALSRLSPHGSTALKGLIAFAVLALAATAYVRNSVWKSEVSLWEDAVSKSPLDARARYNLATVYKEAGMHDAAIRHYEEALRLKPDYPQALSNLGSAYLSKGMYAEAAPKFEQALSRHPNDYYSHNNLSIAYYETGDYGRALDHAKTALALRPDSPKALNNLARAYMAEGMPGEAVSALKLSLKLAPDLPVTYKYLSKAYALKGDAKRADEAEGKYVSLSGR